MDILVLGGTQFVGRHIVESFLNAGHTVSILTRGVTKDELPKQVERLRGDRNDGTIGLKALAGRIWDGCVDVSGYTPRQVRVSAEFLAGNIKRYVFMSAVSVYGDPNQHPVDETFPLTPPADEDEININGETYGPLKVICENIVQGVYGKKCTILRPQVVVGAYDPEARYAYWIKRVLQGDTMLVPGDGSDHLQVIDARDLARFTKLVVEQDLTGVFNLAGPRITWSEFINILGAKNFVWVNSRIIKSAGLTYLELPLFRPDHSPRSSLMDVSNERARTAGLTLTEPKITIQDLRIWCTEADPNQVIPPERQMELLSPEKETVLIRGSQAE